MSIREIAQNFINFCPKYILPLFELCHCFCPNFSIAFAQISEKAMANSGKSNGKFGQKQWENFGTINEKTRKAEAYFSGKNYCFFTNLTLLLPEFFVFYFFGGGGPCPRLLCLWLRPSISRTSSIKTDLFSILLGRKFIFQQNDTMTINFGLGIWIILGLFEQSNVVFQICYFFDPTHKKILVKL